jgi:uncharacterized protein (TIGR02453 family)
VTPTDRLPAASLAFLEDLAAHNDRAWFDANRGRCETDLVLPARALVRDVLARLARPFPKVTGSDAKSGGSLTRLHRDTRFGKDPRPFHSHLGMHFWHAKGRKMEVPGFFVRVAPDEVLVATGMHAPEPPDLARIRKAIDEDPKGWERASRAAAFRKAWGGLEGESLKRVPAPFPADHRDASDLRRKDFTAFARWKPAEATRAGFSARLVSQWESSEPLMAFLCRALRLPW